MGKSPQWESAILETMNSKKYFIVPLHFLSPLSAKLDKGDFVSADRVVRLVMYKDDQSKWVVEVLTEVPDSNYISALSKNRFAEFTGSGLVQDWNGKTLKSKIFYADTSNKRQAQNGNRGNSLICSTTDWYTCSYAVSDPNNYFCKFNYTSTVCDNLPYDYTQSPSNFIANPSGGGSNGSAGGTGIWAPSISASDGRPTGELCGNYNWKTISGAYYTELRGGGFSLVNRNGAIVDCECPILCIQISTGVGNAAAASSAFNAAWSTGLAKVTQDANTSNAVLQSMILKRNMITYMQNYIYNKYHVGLTLIQNGCSGTIPKSYASYCNM